MTTTANHGTSPEWRHLYEAAVLELDRGRLPVRIEEARRAILQTLEYLDPADAQTEPLINALQVLRDLHRIGTEDEETEVA